MSLLNERNDYGGFLNVREFFVFWGNRYCREIIYVFSLEFVN